MKSMNEASHTSTPAAAVELPPSMANVAEIPPAWLVILEEGSELLVKRFDTAPQAAAYRRQIQEGSGGNVHVVIMRMAVAFAAPAMLDFCSRRLERLKQLTGQHHKHSANRLAEKAELERILAGLIDPDPGQLPDLKEPDALEVCQRLMDVGLLCTSGKTQDGRPPNCTCDVHPELFGVISMARQVVARAKGGAA